MHIKQTLSTNNPYRHQQHLPIVVAKSRMQMYKVWHYKNYKISKCINGIAKVNLDLKK